MKLVSQHISGSHDKMLKQYPTLLFFSTSRNPKLYRIIGKFPHLWGSSEENNDTVTWSFPGATWPSAEFLFILFVLKNCKTLLHCKSFPHFFFQQKMVAFLLTVRLKVYCLIIEGCHLFRTTGLSNFNVSLSSNLVNFEQLGLLLLLFCDIIKPWSHWFW